MAVTTLRQLIARQPDARALVSIVADALESPLSIEDAEGRLLHGIAALEAPTRFPVTYQDTSLGWVSGPERARVVAALRDHLVAKEAERKALGAEVLHLYREVNLIYSFSAKLAALLDLERVANLTLQEARHLIAATDGVILLLDDDSGELTTIAGFGDSMPSFSGFRRGAGIVGAVAETGIAEVVDDVPNDPRRAVQQTAIQSLICAPLRVGERVLGVIALGSTEPGAYKASELKLVTTLGLQAATAIENARLFERTIESARERERLMALHQQTELARAKLQRDLDLAALIQAQLFPSELPRVPGYALAARNRPARSCGGDYFDALAVNGGTTVQRLLLCVADVAGKGLPAALVMSNMQATLRALFGRTASLPQLADSATRLLYASTSPEKYVTAAFAEIVPSTGELTFVGAGHLDNLLLRADGSITTMASTGAPLGLLPDQPPYEETRLTLAPGDCAVLFSDGVTDAQDENGNEFGEAKLVEVLRASSGQSVDAMISNVFTAIDAFVGTAPQFDDITLLIARRDADPR
jgi:sigma-B regulation protein RsbU (phosphoserine phosphatase)